MHAKRRPLISLPCRDPVTLAHAHLPLTPVTYKLHELLTASCSVTDTYSMDGLRLRRLWIPCTDHTLTVLSQQEGNRRDGENVRAPMELLKNKTECKIVYAWTLLQNKTPKSTYTLIGRNP